MATNSKKELPENLKEKLLEENSLIFRDFDKNELTVDDRLTHTYNQWNSSRPIVAIKLAEEFADEHNNFDTEEAALSDYKYLLEEGKDAKSPYMIAAAAQTAREYLSEEKYVEACEELLNVVEPDHLDELECAYQNLNLKEVVDESTWKKYQRENFYDNLKDYDKHSTEKKGRIPPHNLVNALKIAKEDLEQEEYNKARKMFAEYVEKNNLVSEGNGKNYLSDSLGRIGEEFEIDLNEVYSEHKQPNIDGEYPTAFRKEPKNFFNVAKTSGY